MADRSAGRSVSAPDVRRHNRALLLRGIAASPGRSRATLATELGLSAATVSSLVEELVAAGLVRETAPAGSGRGRPALPLELDPAGPALLGVELGVTDAHAVVVDPTGAVLARGRVSLDGTRTPPATLRRLVAVAEEVVDVAARAVVHGAVAVPGLLDREHRVRRLPNLPGWQGRDIAAELGAALRLSMRADNEANLAALAELHSGAAGGDFLHVSGEEGVGAAVVLDGAVFRGARGFAGELGHVVVDPAGPTCGCGARGCLEQYAGTTALLRAGRVGSVAALAEAAQAGRPRARQALADAGAVLGRALAGAVNVLDVPAVVLGGAYASLFEYLAGPVREQLAAHVLSRDIARTEVLRSAHGELSAALGAALGALDDVLAGRVPVTR